MPSLLADPVRPVSGLDPSLVDGARLVLCDLDGCLVSEGRAFSDAPDFVRGCGDRFRIVSNNSTHTADGLAADLAAMGLAVPAAHILLAGHQTLLHLHDIVPGARLALFASPAIEREARRLGFDLDAPEPEVVLLCRDPGFSLDRLDVLTGHLAAGAALWVANTDTAHPGQAGQPIAETGALLAAVKAVLPDTLFRSIGKPHAAMARAALGAAGIPAIEAVFVGDNPVTDGATARDAGVPFILLTREART
ncbi:HAD hydrolase-like protein [Marinibacterium sp. SX1]|uniref:HAD hydrolase-like protein n=1 Tax=Marinibacterium sp. SX1 TaxID=3388424 RepID=UPI003D181F02